MKSIASLSLFVIGFCLLFFIANGTIAEECHSTPPNTEHAQTTQFCSIDTQQAGVMRLVCDLPPSCYTAKDLDDKKTKNLFHSFYSSHSSEIKLPVAEKSSFRKSPGYTASTSPSQLLSALMRLNI